MSEREALKLALEALERLRPEGFFNEAIIAIKEALAQPEQEPVAWWNGSYSDPRFSAKKNAPGIGVKGVPLYTAPPQRTEQEPCDMGEMCLGCSPRRADGSCPDAKPWVGLTDLQKQAIKFAHSKMGMMMINYDLDAMLEATEQALKEKNT